MGDDKLKSELNVEKSFDDLDYGLLIRVSKDFSKIEIKDKFIYDGKEYTIPKGMIPLLFHQIKEQLDKQEIHGVILNALLESDITVNTPAGIKKFKFPDLLSSLVVDKIQTINIRNQVGKGIIRP